MRSDRQQLAMADYLVLAFSPALVIGLVSSLVLFLLEVLYAGAYGERLTTILFCFVMGVVLITRITLTADIADRAGLYGLVLGGLVWLGMQQFVEYPEGSPARSFAWLINLALMGVVWWSGHRLTRDCTHVDADAEIGNEGLLDAAGVSPGAVNTEESAHEADAAADGKKKDWLARYRAYREEQRKKRIPGVWVVYFSLAALPLFGMGQALLPTDALDRRRYTFTLLATYLACGLGLLGTTTFLGLRRDSRGGARMPASLAGTWLAATGLLIAAFLALAALVPRPLAEYSLLPTLRPGSGEARGLEGAVRGDSSGKGAGKPSGDADGKADASPDKDGKSKGRTQNDQGEGKGKENGQADEKASGQGKEPGAKDKSVQENKGEANSPAQGQTSSSQPPPRLPEGFRKLAAFLKWVVFAALALVVLVLLFRSGLRFLANFTDWARRWLDAWNAWWGGMLGPRPERDVQTEAEPEKPRPTPFAAFDDPFATGRAARMSVRELTIYSFLALEAWAAERRLGRGEGETPLEFSSRVAGEVPVLEKGIERLGDLYTRAAYARGSLPDAAAGELQASGTR